MEPDSAQQQEAQLEKQLQDVFARSQKIAEKINDLYAEAGITPEQLSTYLSNAENFTPEQWQMMQQHRESMEKSLWDMVGHEKKAEYEAKQGKVKAKKRHRKSLGSRRGWIQMD